MKLPIKAGGKVNRDKRGINGLKRTSPTLPLVITPVFSVRNRSITVEKKMKKDDAPPVALQAVRDAG